MLSKFLFTFSLILGMSFHSKADQLGALTLDQAIAATEYLQNEEAILLWCACCEGDQIRVAGVTGVYYAESGTFENGEKYYTVYINGIDSDGNEIVGEALDLAYVHVIIENTAYCLGTTLGFDCDPCVEPFSIEEWLFVNL